MPTAPIEGPKNSTRTGISCQPVAKLAVETLMMRSLLLITALLLSIAGGYAYCTAGAAPEDLRPASDPTSKGMSAGTKHGVDAGALSEGSRATSVPGRSQVSTKAKSPEPGLWIEGSVALEAGHRGVALRIHAENATTGRTLTGRAGLDGRLQFEVTELIRAETAGATILRVSFDHPGHIPELVSAVVEPAHRSACLRSGEHVAVAVDTQDPL